MLGLVSLAVIITPAAASASSPHWEAERGGFQYLYDVAAVSPDDIWAVGSGIAHFEGDAWVAIDPRPQPVYSLKALDLLSEKDGWAVGHEMVAQLASGQWLEPAPLPGGVRLADVHMLSGTDGWAVGEEQHVNATDKGVIYHFDGSSWAQAAEYEGVQLESVWMASASEGWAVGAQGTILHYDEGMWAPSEYLVEDHLHGVYGNSASEVWVVGGTSKGTSRRVILHYDGTTWDTVLDDENGMGLSDIVVRDGQGWAVGWGCSVLHYNGANWTDVGPAGVCLVPYTGLLSVKFVPGTDYAVAVSDSGGIVRLENGLWHPWHRFRELLGIAMFSAEDGWAVGNPGPALHYDGEHWEEVDSPAELARLHDIDGLAADDIWGVGSGGRIMHYDGTAWVLAPSPTDVNLRRVRMYSPTEGWAVGCCARRDPCGEYRGVVLRFDGTSWSVFWEREVDGDLGTQFHDVDAAAPDDIWVASTAGMWHYNGDSWSRVPPDSVMLTVDMLSPLDGWAGGSNGRIYHWGGERWIQIVELPIGSVERIQMNLDGTGWAVGWQGYVLRYDGRTWRPVRQLDDPRGSGGSPYALFDIDQVRSNNELSIWTCGATETILRWNGESPGRRSVFLPWTHK